VTDLEDGPVDAVAGVDEDLFPPDPLRDLLPRHQLRPPLQQEKEDLHGDPLQPDTATVAA
jgi:hypothetical protein